MLKDNYTANVALQMM